MADDWEDWEDDNFVPPNLTSQLADTSLGDKFADEDAEAEEDSALAAEKPKPKVHPAPPLPQLPSLLPCMAPLPDVGWSEAQLSPPHRGRRTSVVVKAAFVSSLPSPPPAPLPSHPPPYLQKKVTKSYDDKGKVILDEPLDDPVAEKIRQQRYETH